eukprot:8840465-Prorocentrum_lima.AAC.1
MEGSSLGHSTHHHHHSFQDSNHQVWALNQEIHYLGHPTVVNPHGSSPRPVGQAPFEGSPLASQC